MDKIKRNFLSILCGFLLTLVSSYVLFLRNVPHAPLFMLLLMCALCMYKGFTSALASAFVISVFHMVILTDQLTKLPSMGDLMNILAFTLAVFGMLYLLEHYKRRHEGIEKNLQSLNDNYKTRIKDLEIAVDYDALTMLKSRQAYRRDFGQLLKKETLVVYVDVDDFKKFNDRYGHKTGDVVLESVADQLIKIFGRDHCYRYGGDEFILVLPHKDDQKVLSSLQKIQERLTNFHYLNEPLRISFTAGYCYGKADTSHVMRQIMKQADLNLYYSKARGKGSIYGSEYYPMEFDAY